MKYENDPIGFAIQDYLLKNSQEEIIVKSDLCEDDILPVHYLFRGIDDMPDVEKFALAQCEGKILDIGAGTGCHSKYLSENGFEVLALEKSKGACQHLKDQNISHINIDFMQYKDDKYDTILMLMNGIGLAGTLEQLPNVLAQLKSLLNEGGKILCDSTDISYLYTNEDGSVWMDLNASYYGEMNFNMVYKGIESGWFPWLYIDQNKLIEYGTNSGFDVEILLEGENNHYLAELINE